MKGFYQISQALFNELDSHGKVNKITIGDLAEVDLSKQNIYPLAHLIPGTASKAGKTLTLTMVVILLDLVDVNKEEDREQIQPFFGSDNVQDVWHETLNTLVEVAESFSRGDSFDLDYQVIDPVNFEPAKEVHENNLAGWEAIFNIRVVYGADIC